MRKILAGMKKIKENIKVLLIGILSALNIYQFLNFLYFKKHVNKTSGADWDMWAPLAQNILSSVLSFLALAALTYLGLDFFNGDQTEKIIETHEKLNVVSEKSIENNEMLTTILEGNSPFKILYSEDIKFSELFETSEDIYILTNYFKSQISSIKPSIEICAKRNAKITLLMPDENNKNFVKNLTRVYEKTEDEIKSRIQQTEKTIREIYEANKNADKFNRILTEDLGVFVCLFLKGKKATIVLSSVDFQRSKSGIKAPFFILDVRESDKLFIYFKGQLDFLIKNQEKVKDLKKPSPRKKRRPDGSSEGGKQ